MTDGLKDFVRASLLSPSLITYHKAKCDQLGYIIGAIHDGARIGLTI